MEYIEAALKLGLPVMIMSWWVHSWLIRNDLLEREFSDKETDEAVKNIRKSKQNLNIESNDYWTNKWLRFGGGFYGLTALWTFIVIELQGLLWVVTNFSAVVDLFSDGIVKAFVNFLVNQAMSIAHAFSWVVNWGGSGFSLIWFFAAYIGFYLGMKAAKQEDIKIVLTQVKETLAPEDKG